MHKLRRAAAAITLALALLAPVGCVSDYDPRYMADDHPSREGSRYRLSNVAKEIGEGILGVGMVVAWLALGAWAESLNGCGCRH